MSAAELETRFADNQDIDIAGLQFFSEQEYLSTLREMSQAKALIAEHH